MIDTLKAALIVGGAILLATALYVYFSPYHSCVRSSFDTIRSSKELVCAEAVGGNVSVRVNP